MKRCKIFVILKYINDFWLKKVFCLIFLGSFASKFYRMIEPFFFFQWHWTFIFCIAPCNSFLNTLLLVFVQVFFLLIRFCVCKVSYLRIVLVILYSSIDNAGFCRFFYRLALIHQIKFEIWISLISSYLKIESCLLCAKLSH